MGDHGIDVENLTYLHYYRVDIFFNVIDKQLKNYISDMHLHNDFLCSKELVVNDFLYSKELVIIHKSWWRQRGIDNTSWCTC